MQVILGVIYHFIGGFASGSFYIPFKKVKQWSWESYWIIGGLFSWLIVPPLAAYLTIPDFTQIIHNADPSVIRWTFIMGVLWGIGGLTYGLGVRYLGVAMGSSIILGLCSVFGSLIPAVYYNFYPKAGKDSISDLISNHWGQLILLGIFVCTIGIILCGRAGSMKEKSLVRLKTDDYNKEFNLGKGIFVSVISGILSACFSFGLEAGSPMAIVAENQYLGSHAGAGHFWFRNNVVYVVLLLGGLATNLVWCVLLNLRNRSYGDYLDSKKPLTKNYLFSAIAGTTWYFQFFFYGMGESRLGNGASSWILHMAFIILIANSWGLFLGEWKGVSKGTKRTVVVAIALIILSILIVGYGNGVKSGYFR